jgi:hypothetical protein
LVVVAGDFEDAHDGLDLPLIEAEIAPNDIATPPPPRLPADMTAQSLDDLTMDLPLEPDTRAALKAAPEAVVAPLEIQHVSMPIEPVAAPVASIAIEKDKHPGDDVTLEMPLEALDMPLKALEAPAIEPAQPSPAMDLTREAPAMEPTREAPALELTREAPAFEPTREAIAIELPTVAHPPDDKTLAEPEISLETATPALDDEPAPESGPQLVAAPAQSDRVPVAAPVEPPPGAPDLSTARMQVSELAASAKPAGPPPVALKPEPVVIAPDSLPVAVAEFMGATRDFHPETIAALIDAALNL